MRRGTDYLQRFRVEWSTTVDAARSREMSESFTPGGAARLAYDELRSDSRPLTFVIYDEEGGAYDARLDNDGLGWKVASGVKVAPPAPTDGRAAPSDYYTVAWSTSMWASSAFDAARNALTEVTADDPEDPIIRGFVVTDLAGDQHRLAVQWSEAFGPVMVSAALAPDPTDDESAPVVEIRPSGPQRGFRVTWTITYDLDEASTPIDAAKAAWADMRRRDSTANCFVVTDPQGHTHDVDLSELPSPRRPRAAGRGPSM